MTSACDLPALMNHVFVDFGIVHRLYFSLIGAKATSFTLQLGANQTKEVQGWWRGC